MKKHLNLNYGRQCNMNYKVPKIYASNSKSQKMYDTEMSTYMFIVFLEHKKNMNT